MVLVPIVRNIDDARRAIQKLASNKLGPNASPVHVGLILTGLTASRLVATNAEKEFISSDLLNWVAGIANEIDITDDEDGTITIGIVNPLIVGKGGIGVATLTDHGILLGSGTGAITPLGVAANGQIPIGSAGADPVLATITGTTNQVNVANAAGTITLSLPQNIHTGASPQFAGLTLTDFAGLLFATAGVISTKAIGTDIQAHGDVLDDLNTLGVNAANSEFLVGTGAGALAWESGATVKTSLGLGVGNSPTFAGLAISGGIIANMIYEYTNNVGVTIEGVLLKDNNISTTGTGKFGINGVGINANAAYHLYLRAQEGSLNENSRVLQFDVNGADRLIFLWGNPILGGQNYLTTGSPTFASPIVTSIRISSYTLDINEWAVLDGVTANMVLDWTTASVGTIDATNIEDKFLRNDTADSTSGVLTAAGFTTAGDINIGTATLKQAIDGITSNTDLEFGSDALAFSYFNLISEGPANTYFIIKGTAYANTMGLTQSATVNQWTSGTNLNFTATGDVWLLPSTNKVGINDGAPVSALDVTGDINTTVNYKVDDIQVIGNRVIDARCDDALNSGDATTDGVIDALRDAMITHGLIAAA